MPQKSDTFERKKKLKIKVKGILYFRRRSKLQPTNLFKRFTSKWAQKQKQKKNESTMPGGRTDDGPTNQPPLRLRNSVIFLGESEIKKNKKIYRNLKKKTYKHFSKKKKNISKILQRQHVYSRTEKKVQF